MPSIGHISYFYPRSPCGERPAYNKSTLLHLQYFYPRSPCGERQHAYQLVLWVLRISIHALLAESDLSRAVSHRTARKFLSTLSLRRATFRNKFLFNLLIYFYPRSPCGERPVLLIQPTKKLGFLSTLSLRRATGCWMVLNHPLKFLSTLSLRRATAWNRFSLRRDFISIHALLAESDHAPSQRPCPRSISIHALLAESDYMTHPRSCNAKPFLSTLSLRRATALR